MTTEHSAKLLVAAHRKGLSVVGKAAKRLIEAHRTRKPVGTADIEIKNEKDAYRVQDAVFAEIWPGAKPAAWKVGGPSDKVEPTAAPIAPESLLRSPARVPSAHMVMIGVEAEIAFRLARDLPAKDRPYTEAEAAAAVGEVIAAIEICDSRIADWKGCSGLWKVADFQANRALVAGDGIADWRHIDFLRQEVEFSIGGKVMKAKGGHSFGNPARLLPWIARHCAKRGKSLRAGDLVTTGAWTGLEIAAPGDAVVVHFPGIGRASVKIER